MNNKKLVIEFDEEDYKILDDWKKLCLGKYGQGGIKKRTIELIKEDLNKLNTSK